ncbi:MAG: response regulator [Campylobacterales bacterium]|nr:response regulator [Campylobacterales bacterium]
MDLAKFKSQTVLYVEDDQAIVDAFTKILRKVFGNVLVAYNGEEGLELYKKHQSDINFVITDIKMPKMDGLDMSELIKQINPDVPCILTTAHGEYDYFLKADQIGIYRYIQKPLNINDLLKALDEYHL